MQQNYRNRKKIVVTALYVTGKALKNTYVNSGHIKTGFYCTFTILKSV